MQTGVHGPVEIVSFPVENCDLSMQTDDLAVCFITLPEGRLHEEEEEGEEEEEDDDDDEEDAEEDEDDKVQEDDVEDNLAQEDVQDDEVQEDENDDAESATPTFKALEFRMM